MIALVLVAARLLPTVATAHAPCGRPSLELLGHVITSRESRDGGG